MGFTLDVSISAVTVFLQGLLSFFSPCVLPLLPLYIGYLSGGTAVKGEDGRMHYKQSKVLLHTVFFVTGVSFAFFLLGLGVSAVGGFFHSYQAMFARTGGILVMLFGLYQMGIFGISSVLGKEHRLPFRLDRFAMSPVTALLMGFTFSFAWTPCVGPALTSVLLMAASAATKAQGFVLIGVYTMGFVLPFLFVGLFTTQLLELFKKYRGVVQYTVKIGGILMVLMGILMFTGKMNDVTGYLSRISGTQVSQTESMEESTVPEKAEADNEGGSTEPGTGGSESTTAEEASGETAADARPVIPAVDFELEDQYGNIHRLEDYRGKTIFLNFWATWCPPCKAEMPDIQKLYEKFSTEGEDAVIVLGVAAPNMGQEGSEEEIAAFMEEKGYTYPVLMDTEGELFASYGIMSFPTTFMIDRDGNVFGYVSGMLSADMMDSIVRQTLDGKMDQR
ncbi:cytochrome c biogenesis protein CcdA [uncultured Enterocloster sp.]|uniref:redoxin domain-containing protein n=1 Tax=Enterocloster sp. TaxID=2719315 RepID=UPI0025CCA0A9|nr:cytochrome c biogenesis protein CcdA [uncultured Enterocloster sp.]